MAENAKHELVFEHPNGMVLTILTDNIYELAEQPWFKLFFQDAMPQPQARVQQPPQRRYETDPYQSAVSPAMQRSEPSQQPVQMPRPKSPVEVPPEQMKVELWNQMSQPQKDEWQQRWLK